MSDIPTIARNFTYFAGLLPGIVPTANLASWGSDTLTANGVDSRNNSYLVDGGWDNDDYLGQNNGAQARVPLDAAQEFQVLTGQFDAEFGRTSGAIVNAVIKSGTNKFHGSAFEFFYNPSTRAKDFFQAQNNLAKADTRKNEFGGSLGGPIKQDKVHFFVDLERVRLNEGRTIQIPARPDLNYTTVTETRVWDSVYRVDHQISANTSWGARWVTEFSPQKNQTNNAAVTLTAAQQEWDRDDTGSIHVNSVLGTNRVNTMRLSLTREDDRFAPNGFPGCKQNLRLRHRVERELQRLHRDQPDGDADAGTEPDLPDLPGRRPERRHALDHRFAGALRHVQLVHPRLEGRRHDMKFGFQMYYVRWHFQNNAQLNGTFTIPSNNSFNPADPPTYPERLTIQAPTDQYITMKQWAYTGFLQDKWHVSSRATFNLGLRYDIDFTPLDETDNTSFSDASAYPVDKNNLSPRVGFTYTLDEGQVAPPDRVGPVLRQDELRAPEQLRHLRRQRGVGDRAVPGRRDRPGAARRTLPDRSDVEERSRRQLRAAQRAVSVRIALRNTGDVFLDNPDRLQPYTQQISAGYQRQLGGAVSASADYVHTMARDQWLLENLNPGLRVNTTASGAINRVDPTYVTNVWQRQNIGEYTYDALNVVLEKRDSNNWSGRISYTLANSRGNFSGAVTATNNYQLLGDSESRGGTRTDRL